MAAKKSTTRSTGSKTGTAKKSTTTKKKATTRKATAKTTPKKSPAKRKPRSTQKYIRNLRNTPVGIRLERQESGKLRFNLKARGQRGDLTPIQKDDLDDAVLQRNIALAVVEVITKAEADEIISKQTTNQQAVHPALSTLRNELGEAYGEDALVVAEEYNEQGQVVATLKNGEVVISGQGNIEGRRQPGESPGTPDYVQGAESNRLPEDADAAYLSDQRAREKREVQAHDILPNVTVEPTQRN